MSSEIEIAYLQLQFLKCLFLRWADIFVALSTSFIRIIKGLNASQ